jgi:glucose/arabinose dehydrogenase
MAFHPNTAENGLFYVNYTAAQVNHATKIVEYQVSADDPNVADPDSARTLLTIVQPFPNHNGGHLAFGPDGYLYASVGDGGHRDDLLEVGQDRSNLLGTLLRIDVDNIKDGAYGIPEDNPVSVDPAFAPEVWAWGLRNPWRFSFDRQTGDLYIADVGQDEWEEINRQPANSPGGENYGWKTYEASHRYLGPDAAGDVVMPIMEYHHNLGCSVTGGYVYRGEAIPALQGYYLFGDYCNGTIWAAYQDTDDEWQFTAIWQLGSPLSSFGEDEDGELYVMAYESGQVYRFDPAEAE